MNRRDFLKSAIAAALVAALPGRALIPGRGQASQFIKQKGITTHVATAGQTLDIAKPSGAQAGDLLIGTMSDDRGVQVAYRVVTENEPDSYIFEKGNSPGWTPIQHQENPLPYDVKPGDDRVGAIMAFEGLDQDRPIAFGTTESAIYNL